MLFNGDFPSLTASTGAFAYGLKKLSGAVYVGEFGDIFSLNLFMIRFFAGLFLGTLYFLRGFGITAWAHAFYDLIVLIRMTTQ